jgi:hypothetical protein
VQNRIIEPMQSRASLYTLVALLLLLAQQVAVAHALSHWDEGYPHKHACEMCATAGQLAGGLTSSAPVLEASRRVVERPPLRRSLYTPQHRFAFHSRAPPSVPL